MTELPLDVETAAKNLIFFLGPFRIIPTITDHLWTVKNLNYSFLMMNCYKVLSYLINPKNLNLFSHFLFVYVLHHKFFIPYLKLLQKICEKRWTGAKFVVRYLMKL